MRHLWTIISTSLLLAGLASCSGQPEGPVDPGTDPAGEGYTISVDKSEIEADGIDRALFIVKDASGNVVSTDDKIGSIYFKNVATGERLERRTKAFTSLENGVFEFVATVSGEETVNSVTITAKNRAKYEKFFRYVAGYKLTGTWCAYCPNMTAGVAGLSASAKDHFVEMAFHASSQGTRDPFAISYGSSDLGSHLLFAFGGMGFPSMIYNLDVLAPDQASSAIEKVILDQRRKHPATCGIRINSSYADGKIEIEAGLKSSTGGDYDLGYLILLDNQTYTAGTATDGKYNNIVCEYSDNFMEMVKETTFKVEVDQEHTTEFTVEDVAADRVADLRVVVFAMRKAGGKTIIDNLAQCKVGESVDYRYNE